MERFLPIDQTRIVMTVYAPIMFPPSGVLAFFNEGDQCQLAAQGTLLSCNPGSLLFLRNFAFLRNFLFLRNFFFVFT